MSFGFEVTSICPLYRLLPFINIVHTDAVVGGAKAGIFNKNHIVIDTAGAHIRKRWANCLFR